MLVLLAVLGAPEAGPAATGAIAFHPGAIVVAASSQQPGTDPIEARGPSARAGIARGTDPGPMKAPIHVRRDIWGDGGTSLSHETLLDASPRQAWAAIATAEGWKSWAVPSAWMDGDVLETSYDAGAVRGAETAIRQLILVKVPERLLVFRTIRAPRGFSGFEAFRQTTHWFELAPEGQGKTRVRLVSAGYPPGAVGSRLADLFSEGNRISLERLRRRFETGPIDWTSEQRGNKR